MENLSIQTLGEVSAITMSTPDLDKSFDFYKKLGFSEVMRTDFPFPLLQITDGALLIMLRKDEAQYISLTYYVKDLDNKIASLEESGIEFIVRPGVTDMIKRYVMRSPDGLSIALVTYVDGFKQPAGPTMLNTPQGDFFNPEKYVNKVCGMFGEFAHPVKDLEVSIGFWARLGFSVLSQFTSPYHWAIISDGLSIVGLHETRDFDYPVITFFAADMAEKIKKIKESGIIDLIEKGHGSVVLNTPEHQHINLFKMGF